MTLSGTKAFAPDRVKSRLQQLSHSPLVLFSARRSRFAWFYRTFRPSTVAYMRSLLFFGIAALGEISGCYAFWAWLRLGKSMLWVLPGLIALAIFAIALTQIETSNAGRAYAAYGGIYILSAIIWLWTVEGVKPDRWDLLGVAVCLIGTGIIMLAPHRL